MQSVSVGEVTSRRLCCDPSRVKLVGGLGLSIEGPSKAEIQCQDNKDGTCTISYVPTTPGEYKITIKYAGQPITDTPFFAKVSAPCKSLQLVCTPTRGGVVA